MFKSQMRSVLHLSFSCASLNQLTRFQHLPASMGLLAEFGTVKQANEDDAIVKWDDDGRQRLGQQWLKKI